MSAHANISELPTLIEPPTTKNSPAKESSQNKIWIKITNWEYWPFGLVYIPVFFYWAWLVLKARSFFFFSASNPSIENGGMLGESKMKIFDLINDGLKPKTIYLKHDSTSDQIYKTLKNEDLNFPLIFKPDIGERGSFVEKIESNEDIEKYLSKIKVDFLIQEYIDYPIEMGVFYYRFPNEEKGSVSSIVVKDMLSVIGDGQSTIKELAMIIPRAKIIMSDLERRLGETMSRVLKNAEMLELEPIGNHCRGTTFLNGNYLITEELNITFDRIAKTIDGFYFGRFDLRCKSIAELYEGKIKILELNGAGSEPGHIYHPGTTLTEAYSAIFHHIKALYKISKQNNEKGIPYMTFSEGISEVKKLRAYNKRKDA